MRFIATGIVTLLYLTGCATKPSYVGKWTGENARVTLDVNADGTFSGVTGDADQPTRLAGTWTRDPTGITVFKVYGSEAADTARLIGKERLVLSPEKETAVQFKRER